MKILTVDIGTGTQDIFLYDSNLDVENGFKLIVPSPTMIIHRQIREATRLRQPVLLTGKIMGGGPSQWAAEEHARRGLPVYATPDAARSFNDDLDAVMEIGIKLVSEDEARRLSGDVQRLELRDFDFRAIAAAFHQFGISLDDLSAVAVAVFDHGNSPLDYSDRKFRFDYLDERIRAENRLSAFAYRAEQVPPKMTRLGAVVETARRLDAEFLRDLPLMIMDTAPAAVLGATLDPKVASKERKLVVNVGNFHTLAFRLGPSGIEGLFEHHTGLLDRASLEDLLKKLAEGSLTNDSVFADHGHGALIYFPEPLPLEDGEYGVVVAGPRRSLLRGSSLRPYFSAPFGDMMIAGCFGLLAAMADVMPEFRGPILDSFSGSVGKPPWELI